MDENEQRLIELIEKYLDGTLHDKGRLEVEEKIKVDPLFAKKISDHSSANKAIDLYKHAFYKNFLEEESRQIKIRKSPNILRKSPKRALLLKIAAGLLIILIACAFLIERRYSNERTFERYFLVYGNLGTVKGSANDNSIENELYLFGKNAFIEKRYGDAIEYLSSYLSSSENENMHGEYMLGVSLMKEEKFEDSIVIFQQIIKDFSHYDEVGQWYLALSYLANNQELEAKEQLKEIIKDDSAFKEDANNLLLELDGIWRKFSKFFQITG